MVSKRILICLILPLFLSACLKQPEPVSLRVSETPTLTALATKIPSLLPTPVLGITKTIETFPTIIPSSSPTITTKKIFLPKTPYATKQPGIAVLPTKELLINKTPTQVIVPRPRATGEPGFIGLLGDMGSWPGVVLFSPDGGLLRKPIQNYLFGMLIHCN